MSATKWLSANVFLWGIATAAVAGVHDYHTLLVARIFLGIFEAAVGPCLILISSQWYSRQEQPLRFSIWYCGVGVGQIIGALTSFGFQFVSNNAVSIANWRIMFIVLGLCTVIVGVATYIFLPESPMTAKWISKSEKVALLEHVAGNKTGVINNQFKASQVLEVFLDPQVYLLFVMEVAVSSDSIWSLQDTAYIVRSLLSTPASAPASPQRCSGTSATPQSSPPSSTSPPAASPSPPFSSQASGPASSGSAGSSSASRPSRLPWPGLSCPLSAPSPVSSRASC